MFLKSIRSVKTKLVLDLADKEEVELVTEDEVGATQILDRLAR